MAKSNRILPQLTQQEKEHFWARIRSLGQDDCWEWQGCRDFGYGTVTIQGEKYKTHRLAYYLHHNHDPQQLHVLHHCDNPPCCNPKHLFLGTDFDNIADRHKKGRDARGQTHSSYINPEKVLKGEEVHTAKLTADDVRLIRRRFAQGNISMRQITREYRLKSHSTVKAIIHRRSWKHVI